MRRATAVALGMLAVAAIGAYALYRQDLDTARERVARGSRIAIPRARLLEFQEGGHVGVGHEADVLAQVAALAHALAARTRAASNERIVGPLLDEDQTAPEASANNGQASPRRRLP